MNKNVLRFLGLAFLISWVTFAVLYFGFSMREGTQFLMTVFLFMWGPFFASLLASKISHGGFFEALDLKLRFNRWLILSFFAPLMLGFLCILIAKVFGQTILSYHEAILDPENVVPVPAYYIMFGVMFIISGLINGPLSISEELGFRGYALKELLSENGFWKTSLFIGFFWGLWHLPIIWAGYNYVGLPFGLSMILMICVAITLSPILNYLTIKSQTVWAACGFHGIFNYVAGISALMIISPNGASYGMLGVFGILAYLSCILVLYGIYRVTNIGSLNEL